MTTSRRVIRNLVFGGVGVVGTAYVGAVKDLEQQLGSFKQIQRLAGASSGSIMALLLALRCNASQIQQFYNSIDFAHIANDENVLADVANLLIHQSLYKNANLRSVYKNLFEEAIGTSNITFQEMLEKGYKDLTIITTMLCIVDGTPTRVMHQFSAEHTPHTQVFTAILASSAIPTVFPMICLTEKTPGQWVEDSNGFVHIDGGFVDDLPIGIFDKKKYYPGDTDIDEKTDAAIVNATVYNPETLGFIVYSNREVVDLETNKRDIQPIRHHQLGKIIYSMVNGAVFGPQMYIFSLNQDLKRTVLIQNLNISAINFRITTAQKDALESSGVEADKKFFTEHPECRPAVVSSTSAFFNNPKTLDTSTPSQQLQRGPAKT